LYYETITQTFNYRIDWEMSYFEDRPEFYDMLIRDVLKVVERKLRSKNISIRKK